MYIANIEPHSYAMASLLGEISVDEHNSGRPLLSAAAILKADNIPGGGFFSLAEDLGFKNLIVAMTIGVRYKGKNYAKTQKLTPSSRNPRTNNETKETKLQPI